jgi:hypothetical protein
VPIDNVPIDRCAMLHLTGRRWRAAAEGRSDDWFGQETLRLRLRTQRGARHHR